MDINPNDLPAGWPVGASAADILRRLYDTAVHSALPAHAMAAHMPQPPKGRTVVIGAGKAAERERLVQFLSGAVADDPAGTHIYGMSKLGLVEITRTRRGPPLADLLAEEGA